MIWAFLVLEAHPYGRQMLARLLDAGFVPDLMIEERSDVAEVEREKFERRIAGYPLAPSFDTLLVGRDVRREYVGNHNDEQCEQLLAELSPDLIVLGGTRILKPRIFEKAKAHTFNAHPGLLPEVRGSASVAWAIHLDEPVGCTTHVIDRGIDTGAVIARREVPVHRDDTYEKLCHATILLSAELMREAVTAFARGRLEVIAQPEGEPARRNMPDDMVAAVRHKLASGAYAHFVD